MKKLLLCGLIVLGGCALKTVDDPVTESAPSTEIQAPVQQSVQKTKSVQKVSKASKTVQTAKKKTPVKKTATKKAAQAPQKKTPIKKAATKKAAQTSQKTPIKKAAMSVTPAKEPLKCADIIGVRLYQIFKTFAMGKTCSMQEKNFFCASGQTVYIETEKGKSYQYDDMILPKSGECFAYDGTFHYHSRGGKSQSAPRVKLITKPKQ